MPSEQAAGVTILYHGHACFTIKDQDGFTVVVDPFDPQVGYKMPQWKADVVLVTHGHYDHANVGAVDCERAPLLEAKGETRAGPLVIRGVTVPHWASLGDKARGEVTAYRWEQGGVALCHLGDLAQLLTAEQTAALKPVDVLFVPVGGKYTVGPAEAVQVVEQLEPAIVVPMHYRTAYSKLTDIQTVGEFLKKVPESWEVRQEAGNFIFVGPQTLATLSSRPTVWVINP
ncbi:MAG: MBL fold metallo-hydrolase [Armatimonadota bacterium]